MADLTLNAEPRALLGKKSRRLRRSGLLPAVVYGPAVREPRALQLDARAFDTVYRAAGMTQLVDLVIDGQRQSVFIRDVQYNLLRRAVDHVDFYAANLNVETIVAVPVVLTGEAPIVARGEGVVSLEHQTVNVRALPAHIPALFEVDASRIESVDNDVRVGDLTAPAGVTIVDDPDTVIVSVSRSTVDVEVEEAAEAAAAEAAEAATAETAEGAAEETDEPAAADENV